jgi:hypothetical protein
MAVPVKNIKYASIKIIVKLLLSFFKALPSLFPKNLRLRRIRAGRLGEMPAGLLIRLMPGLSFKAGFAQIPSSKIQITNKFQSRRQYYFSQKGE